MLYTEKVIERLQKSEEWTCQKSRTVCYCDIGIFKAEWYIFPQLGQPKHQILGSLYFYFFFCCCPRMQAYPYTETVGPIIFWNKTMKEIFIPWQIPRFKVSVGVFHFVLFSLEVIFTHKKISLTQELHSTAASASKSQSEGGVWTLDIFSHKICELQKYVNYTYICLFFQRNSLHCSKKNIAHRKLAE